MNRLILIDGNAMLHRAYHALPPMRTPDGRLVNAVYGFTAMLIKLCVDLKPTHISIAFDRPEPTFRKKLFKEYQAHRPELDDGMVSQFPIVRDVIDAFGIPAYDAAGFEADDVIGSIVAQVQKGNKEEVVVVTGDRDILQLVDDKKKVKVFMPTKGLSEGKLYGEKDVEERMGVPPNLIPDFKALAGDPSDNYPGVAGVGPKTAVTLLKEFPSIEKLLAAASKGKVKETVANKLTVSAANLTLCHELAKIRTDAPVKFDGEKARVESLDTLDSRKLLGDLHFPSLLKRLSGNEPKPVVKTEQKKEEKKDDSEQLPLV